MGGNRIKSDIVEFPITQKTRDKLEMEKILHTGEKISLMMIDGTEKVTKYKSKTTIDQKVYQTHSHGAARYVALFAHLGLLAGIYHGANKIPQNVGVTSALYQDLSGKMQYTALQSIDAAHYYGAAYTNLGSDLGGSPGAQIAIKYVNDFSGKTGFSIGGSCINQGLAERAVDMLDINIAKDFLMFLQSSKHFYNQNYISKLSDYHNRMIDQMTKVATEYKPKPSNDKDFDSCYNSNAAEEFKLGMLGASKHLYSVYGDAYEVGFDFGQKI